MRLVGSAAFIVVGLIVYWTGWDTLWRLSIPLAVGAALFAWRVARHPEARAEIDLRPALWLGPYVLGLVALAFVGNFGGGRGWLPFGWDIVVVALFSLAMLPWAVHLRLPADEAEAYVAQDQRAMDS